MALHGEICVNGRVIGTWKAVRQTVDLNEWNRYSCTVRMDQRGIQEVIDKFTISHRFADGALVLAAKVLACASGGEFQGALSDEG